MRISSINQVSQVYQSSLAKKKNVSSFAEQKDAISISHMGRDYQTAKNALANTPDVRQDRIDSLKQSISEGTYSVSSRAFAEKMLAAYQQESR